MMNRNQSIIGSRPTRSKALSVIWFFVFKPHGHWVQESQNWWPFILCCLWLDCSG
jgi:hypothetical protein